MPDSMRADTKYGIDLRAVSWVMAALCATLIVAAATAYLVWRSGSSMPRQLAPNARPELHVAGVVLESSPRSVRADYVAEKERLLHTREWIDADTGIARIPIEAAMRALAERDAARRGEPPATRPPR